MKIALIQAPLPEPLLLPEIFDTGLRYMPLNLAYLGAMLEHANYETKIYDINILMISAREWAEKNLSKLEADIVGLSCTTNSYIECMKLAKMIKDRYPDTIIVVGGCHVTFLADQVLRECHSIDIVARGEGENIIVEICDNIKNKKSLDRVLGISYRKEGIILHNDDALIIKDLDLIPFPARHLLPLELYPNHGIITSRGCPRQCIFCSAGAMSSGVYRIRSAANIIDELKLLKNDKEIFFYDNTFSTHINKSKDICQSIINEKLDINWEVELRADTVTEEFINIMRESGCIAVQFGVESGNGEILKEMKKHITKDQVRKAAGIALSSGMDVACSFTIGHPSETEQTIQESLEFMLELQAMGCKVFPGIVTPYPGTEIYNKKEDYGIKIHHYDWSKYTPLNICLSTRYLTREKLGQQFLHMFSILDPERIYGGEL